mgnify:CR=1 FL=1
MKSSKSLMRGYQKQLNLFYHFLKFIITFSPITAQYCAPFLEYPHLLRIFIFNTARSYFLTLYSYFSFEKTFLSRKRLFGSE